MLIPRSLTSAGLAFPKSRPGPRARVPWALSEDRCQGSEGWSLPAPDPTRAAVHARSGMRGRPVGVSTVPCTCTAIRSRWSLGRCLTHGPVSQIWLPALVGALCPPPHAGRLGCPPQECGEGTSPGPSLLPPYQTPWPARRRHRVSPGRVAGWTGRVTSVFRPPGKASQAGVKALSTLARAH